MKTTYWVYATDFVSAIIGPFASRNLAEAHIGFCVLRGDGATMRVVTSRVADRLAKEDGITERISVEEDLVFDPKG